MTDNTLLLAGDIGGTKTTLALYRQGQPPEHPLAQHTFQNCKATDFYQLVEQFLQQSKTRPAFGCFGIAGPVTCNQAQMTNLDWTISAKYLQQQFHFKRAFLINDLVATTMGAVLLPEVDLKVLNSGSPVPGSAVAVLAPGTGLGHGFLTHEGTHLSPHPSEGGHISFAPRGALQMQLLAHMQRKYAHVSVEHVCSGSGLPNLFDFMQTLLPMPPQLSCELASVTDKTPLIISAALDALHNNKTNHIALQAVLLFVDILADQAANLALTTMALGGIFLGGGLTPRIEPFINQERFMSLFTRGIYQDLLHNIPIKIILNPQTATMGAAAYGLQKIETT